MRVTDSRSARWVFRLAFGARPCDFDKVRQMGVDAWIEQQLHPDRIADPAVSQLIAQLPTYAASSDRSSPKR